jgi:hypothetical protein
MSSRTEQGRQKLQSCKILHSRAWMAKHFGGIYCVGFRTISIKLSSENVVQRLREKRATLTKRMTCGSDRSQ